MPDQAEKKSPTEALEVQQKMQETLAGERPIDSQYPYFPPDYEIPFLHIGREKQLFLDNFILDHLEGIERSFPQPERPEEPLIQLGELPWEHRQSSFPVAALQDPDDAKFKLWYTIPLGTDVFGDSNMVLCYAESSDCLHWEKPLSEACRPYKEQRATNIVLEDSGHHIGLVLNHDQSDPERKYLLVYNAHDLARSRGQRTTSTLAASAEGLCWTTINQDTARRHHHFQRIIWDEAVQKWIAYSQYSHHWNFIHRKRQVGRQESADFIHWSPKEVVLSADWEPNLPPHLEFQDMSVRKIGSLYIGLVTEFLAEKLWSRRNNVNWRDIAHARLSLYCSRDGKRWQRAGGTAPWADNRKPGSCDYGFVAPTVAGQLVHRGKTHIFYNATSDKQHWYDPPPDFSIVPEDAYEAAQKTWTEGHQRLRRRRAINALILREDGWAELKPSYEQGRVITRQFVFEGDALRINADCCGGHIRVEILAPDFKPYEGFSATACAPVCSDDPEQIWHRVRWCGKADLRSLWNEPVRLVFHLYQASLFAFQFLDSNRSEQ